MDGLTLRVPQSQGLEDEALAAPRGQGYYLLGDDPRDSSDSRFERPLNLKRIRGRAWLIVWPLSRARFVNR